MLDCQKAFSSKHPEMRMTPRLFMFKDVLPSLTLPLNEDKMCLITFKIELNGEKLSPCNRLPKISYFYVFIVAFVTFKLPYNYVLL